MCDNLLKEEKERAEQGMHSPPLPPPPPLLTRPHSLCPWRDGAVWRWEHWDAGRMDDLLRGWMRYYFKSFSPPPSEVRGTSCRRLFQRMGNLEAGIIAHLKKALGKNQSCISAMMYEPWMSTDLDTVLQNKCSYISYFKGPYFCISHVLGLFCPFEFSFKVRKIIL